LQPDLVIAQSHCEVCAVTPGDVSRGGDCFPMLALSAASVDDIFASVGAVAGRIGLADRGVGVVARERARMETVSAKTAGLRRPTLVMLEWTDPLFAMGNWGPELVEIANGELRIGKKGEYSSAIAGESLAAADPEFLIVAPCGFDLARTLRERRVLEQYSWWSGLRAVREGKVAFADGNRFFNRSGMTITQTAEIIAEILHGVTFGAPARGEHWLRMGDFS
jgi:iron complex transport system substrate-binding protein